MKQIPQPRQKLGNIGEDLAASYLRRLGYSILDRNYKARYGEIDIIALDHDTLVFVEVKTRTNTSFGTPEEAVTPRKLAEVVKTAEYYKSTHDGLPEELRVDVIGIQLEGRSPTHINHIQNVTG